MLSAANVFTDHAFARFVFGRAFEAFEQTHLFIERDGRSGDDFRIVGRPQPILAASQMVDDFGRVEKIEDGVLQ